MERCRKVGSPAVALAIGVLLLVLVDTLRLREGFFGAGETAWAFDTTGAATLYSLDAFQRATAALVVRTVDTAYTAARERVVSEGIAHADTYGDQYEAVVHETDAVVRAFTENVDKRVGGAVRVTNGKIEHYYKVRGEFDGGTNGARWLGDDSCDSSSSKDDRMRWCKGGGGLRVWIQRDK